MQRFKKLIIALIAVLMIISVPLAAAEMSVRWEWALDDPDATLYRYQIGGEDPDSWTVLDPDTDSLELSGLDAGSEYTLYLQRSYDGINWSPSAVSTAKADLSKVPDVRIYRYDGYELKAEIRDGSVTLIYPDIVTDSDAAAFIAYESEKYGLGDSGITYSISSPSVVFSYSQDYSREMVAGEVDTFVNDLIDYITAPQPAPVEEVPEPVAEEPVPAPVVEETEEAIVREYEYAGYTLTATIDSGKAVLLYPAFITDEEVSAFFAVENAKYGLADLGVSYAFGVDGEVTLTYPAEYTNEEAASMLDELVDDLIAYITTPASVEEVPEPVAEEPVPVPVVEETEEAIVREYEYAGYTLTATIDSGKAVLLYPAFVTDEEVSTFFAVENAKYGLADLGVSYAFGVDGEVTLTYPAEYSNEEAASMLDELVDDLIAYITTPAPASVVEEAEEPVVEETEEAIVREYEYAGYTLTATIDSGKAVLLYPAFVTDEEVSTFFAVENAKYGLADLGVSYAFGVDGEVTLTYPAEYTNEEAASMLDELVDDLIAYITPAPAEEPAVAETPEPVAEPEAEAVLPTPIAPIAPVEIAEEEDNPFAFSLLLRGGVASAFDNSFNFNGPIFAEAGLGFDFSRIVAIGDNFGFGLRSDLVVDFVPKANGKWDLEDKLQYFNLFNYAEMTSLDLKLTMDVVAGPMDLYVGGGVGFAIGNPHDNTAVTDNLQLGSFSLGNVKFAMDWFASAIAGVRFYIGDVFSIGAEVNYRYIVESQTHMGSADVVLGFTF